MTKEIEYIQNYLKTNEIDCYIVFTNDDHGSEYVVDYYKARAFLSGFTGSAGTMIITKDSSYLWTDGRYFLQASRQLASTGTQLMKMGMEGVPSINEFVIGLNEKVRVALDFKLATVSFMKGLMNQSKNVEFVDNGGIIDEVWKNRPIMKIQPAYILTDEEAGESIDNKITRTLSVAKKSGCPYVLVSSLDDIAWLFNLRGNDITYNPVNYAYSILSEEKKVLYINPSCLSKNIQNYFENLDIQIKNYDEVYTDIQEINDNILIDEAKTNYCLYAKIKNKKSAYIFPTTAFKTIKNETEIEHMKQIHKQDAVAMIKFMRWLKQNVGKIEMDELSVQEKLANFRKEGKDFLDLSFGTICGYAGNGAVIHYSATEETNKKVINESLLLVDSGAQYRFGTTDITRTFVLGKLTDQQKKDFTSVLKAHIALGSAIFPKGTNGMELDMICRMPLFKQYRDYNHGTGHGVGYLLNVHEGPQSISMRANNKFTSYPFIPGMITSNEPGLYIENEYGVRHESLILCVEKLKNEYNTFYGFETITYVPFDKDGIDKNMLTDEEKQWLNSYHKLCYDTISPLLDEEHKKYLAEITEAI